MVKKIAYSYVPEKINMRRLVELIPPGFNYHIDNFNYILSLITEIPAYDQGILYNSYVPLNSSKLQRRIHNNSHYLRYLVAHKILLTDNHYIPGKKSRGYKFHPDVISPVVLTPIERKCLIRSLLKPMSADKVSQKKYPDLYKWFSPQLKIDLPGATEFLMKEFKQDTRKLGMSNAILRFNKNYVSACKFESRRFFFHVDTTGNRLHTNLTSMKSGLRNYITYDGRGFYSLDLKNSQALLSCLLLDWRFYTDKNEGGFIDLASLSVTEYIESDTIQSIASYIMLVKDKQRPEYHDIDNYVQHCQKGTLYEYINIEIEKETGKSIPCRRRLKEVVFTVLFTDNRFIGQVAAQPKRVFKRLFPNVYEIFSLLKKKESTLLPMLLQRIESRLMLDMIVPAIVKKFPRIPIYTIHDSIATLAGHENDIIAMIKAEMYKATGLACELRTDKWELPA